MGFDSAEIWQADGTRLASWGDNPLGDNHTAIQNLITQSLSTRSPAISRLFSVGGPETHAHALISMPISDPNDDAQEVFVADIDVTSSFQSILQHQDEETEDSVTSFVTIANNPSGYTKFASQPLAGELLSGASSTSHLNRVVPSAFAEPENSDHTLYHGGQFLDYVKIEGVPWSIVTQMDGDEIFGHLDSQARNMSIAYALTAFLGIFAFVAISRRDRSQLVAKEFQAQLKNLELENRFDYVSQNANDAIFLIDGQGVVLEANKRAEELYEWPTEQMIGLDFDKLCGRLDQESLFIPPDEIVEELHTTRTGKALIVFVRKKNVMLEENAWQQIIVQDITDRRMAEEKAQQTEMRLRGALDSVNEGYCVVGFDWRILYTNEASAHHLRRNKADLELQFCHEVFPEFVGSKLFEKIENVLSQRTSEHLELSWVFEAGSRNWFEIIIEPVAEGASLIGLDITQRKLAQEKVNTAALVLSNSPAVLYRTDYQDSAKITFISENISIYGYRVDEVVDQNVADFIHPDDFGGVMRAVMQTGGSDITHGRVEYRAKMKSGVYRWVQDHHRALVNDEGNVIGAEGVFIDITDVRDLLAAKANLAAMLNASRDAVISLDTSARVVSWNLAAQEFYGIEGLSASGHQITKLVSFATSDEERIFCSALEVLQEEHCFISHQVDSTGSALSVLVDLIPIFENNGDHIGTSMIVRNLTNELTTSSLNLQSQIHS